MRVSKKHGRAGNLVEERASMSPDRKPREMGLISRENKQLLISIKQEPIVENIWHAYRPRVSYCAVKNRKF